jgi:hypothetical protein
MVSPAFMCWPATMPSHATKRRVFCTGASQRAVSRTTARSASRSWAAAAREPEWAASADSVLAIRAAVAS